MFNSSLRRVARTCPNAGVTSRHNPTSSSKTGATFSTRSHQRRYSSSKPPVPPNNGSSAIPTTTVKQVGAPRSSDKRPGAESRLSKRKATKGEKAEQSKQEPRGNEWTFSLPSVPSTHHLTLKDVHVASFFSTHRPISISGPLPAETQIEDIDKIFQVRSKKVRRNNAAEVIYTLQSAVHSLDEHIQNPQQQDPAAEQRADIIKSLTQHNNGQVSHLDGQPRGQNNIKLVIEDLARRFKPFNAPPPPVPVPELEFYGKQDAAAAEAEAQEDLQAKQLEKQIESQDVQRIVIDPSDVAQSLDSGFFTSHKSPMGEPASQPRPTAIRRSRRKVYVDPLRSHIDLRYQLISVKRQRKLKMKKHKYKKLMRKTRNLRRRLDKL